MMMEKKTEEAATATATSTSTSYMYFFKRLGKKKGGLLSWKWKLRSSGHRWKWNWKRRFSLHLWLVDDLLFKIVYVAEAIVLVSTLCFFFLCCGCHI